MTSDAGCGAGRPRLREQLDSKDYDLRAAAAAKARTLRLILHRNRATLAWEEMRRWQRD